MRAVACLCPGFVALRVTGTRARAVNATWLVVAIGLVPGLVGPVPAAEPTPVREQLLAARRIVALGDSVTHDGGWLVPLIAWLEATGWTGELINMGLPSETVSGLSEAGHAGGAFPRPDLHERLDRVLRVARPDLVVACYGMNCGIYQPLDETRFARFKEGIRRLHDTVEGSGTKIIHLTPPVYDQRPDQPGPAGAVDYDAVLEAFSIWLLARRAEGWSVIDVHGPMEELLAAARHRDPQAVFAPDAVHPNAAGHWAFARSVFAGLGEHETAAAETPDRFAAFVPDVRRRMEVLRDAYLAAAGHRRPGLPSGLPLGAAEAEASRLTESIRARRPRPTDVR